jgi:ubiquinone/menaquinone biosynthesis C-methylase UbiE
MTQRLSGSDIAGAYDRWAAAYDNDVNATRDLDAMIVRRFAPDPTGLEVLELGCGTGKNTAWLAERARRVTALDFSAGMLDVARARMGGIVHFLQHDVRAAWPIETSSVDVVIGDLVLEHVEAVDFVFAEAARVMRPGGRVFFCELHPFRQQRGGQAHFTDPSTGHSVYVEAFAHSVSEYLMGGVAAGLILEGVGEWLSDNDSGGPPRLFSVLFRKA